MKVRRTLATVTAALLVGSMPIAGAAQAAPNIEDTAWSPALLSAELLYDGSAVRTRYQDGASVITVVASTGAKVIFKGSKIPTIMANGLRSYDREVSVVQPRTVNSSRTTAAAYSAAGRSVFTDALAAGMSPSEAQQYATTKGVAALDDPPILNSWCMDSENGTPDPEFNWSGCHISYEGQWGGSEGNWTWYDFWSATAHGWGTGVLAGGKELQKGYVSTDWVPDVSTTLNIIEASPSANQPGPNPCSTFTVGLSQVVELGFTIPLCRAGWDVTWNQSFYKVEWHGASTGGQSDTRSAAGAHTIAARGGYQVSGSIGWTYACLGC
ncbi:hypothetical protein O7626_30565 [Micromonospora sp. WMMD1102]|uniref:hypothetical protein n=1 Tax=Micromonospora sp. WMMD1102 TaxID=3016105 RepID=UPI002415566A|nr:hypothetical protein [Micromonospora sp. WMMD1102]MDG4790215.1 hypothetical protein [Micromonospora sp. WMMD1102]